MKSEILTKINITKIKECNFWNNA